MGEHRRALKTGKRELARAEVLTLQGMHAELLRYATPGHWLGHRHADARLTLCNKMASLADAGVPISHLAAAIGVSKTRAHQLVGAGRS